MRCCWNITDKTNIGIVTVSSPSSFSEQFLPNRADIYITIMLESYGFQGVLSGNCHKGRSRDKFFISIWLPLIWVIATDYFKWMRSRHLTQGLGSSSILTLGMSSPEVPEQWRYSVISTTHQLNLKELWPKGFSCCCCLIVASDILNSVYQESKVKNMWL